MSTKLRYFFLGSLGLVVLALIWIIYRTKSDLDSDEYFPVAPINTEVRASDTNKVADIPSLSPPQSKATPSSLPSSAPGTSKLGSAGITSLHTYVEPNTTIYLDQSADQKAVLNYIDFVSSMKFPPVEEPLFVGVNDQGFDQYEYKARDGSQVRQWKRSGEVSIEEVTLENGDKITRRASEQDVPVTTISYETKDEKIYKSVNYRNDGTVQAIYTEENGKGVTYYYDQQGRLTGTRFWKPAEKK